MNSTLIKTRNKLILLSLILFIINFSCSKNSNIEPKEHRIKPSALGLKLYSSISTINDIDAKRIAYGSLSNVERFQYWKARLSNLSNSGRFSELQIEKINNFSSALFVEYFENSDKKAIFNTEFIPNWVKTNEKVFTSFEVFDILFSIAPEQSSASISQQKTLKKSSSGTNILTEETGANCICALGSSYTCPLYIAFPLKITYFECYKGTATCTETVRGCGALMDDACDGNFCPAMNT